MKKVKFLSGVLCCVAAMSLTFTSCTDDTGDSNITAAQALQAYNAVKGSYTGKMIYNATNPNNSSDDTDTLAVTWQIATDSTLVINDFPTSLLAENVLDADMKAALLAEPNQDLTCYTNYFRLSPVAFWVTPKAPAFNVTYGGNTHKIQIAFYGNSSYSFGAMTTTGKMQIQLVEAAVYVDGTLSSSAMTTIKVYNLISDSKN